MRVLVLGGTGFTGRQITRRLLDRGDRVLVVHRGRTAAPPEGAEELRTDRRALAEHADRVRAFDPEAIVDAYALTGDDVDAVLPVLPPVPAVVLSSADVYLAFTGLRTGRELAPLPIDEDSPLRTDRRPYRGAGLPGVPEDYEKLDVEERWLARGAVVLRAPVVYGPHDAQRREDVVLRRVRAKRARIPVGAANLLWSRLHVDDLAAAVLAALDTRAADGQALNVAEARTCSVGGWLRQILDAAESPAELVRVPDSALPPDLAATGASAQHLLVSSARAQDLLGWRPGDPATRVAESVRWHLAHPSPEPWTEADTAADDAALAAADG
ncbi:NAD-dependent epimerase/dehydratase family protein [Streptomonospora nanhaiensis]|uniref:Nucleoside-diphosphate-sugar epimerase n=1 Tax=Streptomonospora nanhaiensis TaxID=1323731 RepID=A0A853BSA4_9ACTN|nr:NAD-dependent epimerase/dehydratase family protein [Streptomonospora nanhaiensis]MBX9388800.1 NAD-dependent epimerase/dehydratase family protein [Streptomonospora nanhaiensis]NYI97596.1 nucleoside-diphosphate-sugar epimerase [Streptomonospora nanhaiensis]